MNALLSQLLLDVLCLALLLVAARRHRAEGLELGCAVLNLVTFALAWALSAVEGGVGLGLSLFAIFGILRYRTRALPIAELTLLFSAIGVGLIAGLPPGPLPLLERALLAGLLGALPLLHGLWRARRGERVIELVYDRPALLRTPAELQADLQERLGLRCRHLEVLEVDLLRETARLKLVVEQPPA